MTPNLETQIEVACAGIVVADCVARPVVKQPKPGQLELVDRIGLYSGGSAANTGYDLARLGVSVALIGRVGQDGFGDFLEAEAMRVGCDSSLLKRDQTASTSASFVTVTPDGERAFLHSIGANAKLIASDVPLEPLKARGAKVLHLAGFFILPGMEGTAGEPTRDLFRSASALGFITSLDCVWDATGRWGELIHSVLPETDLFCPSIFEARAIVGHDDARAPLETAEALLKLGIRQTVALKMGPEGSFVMAKDGEHHHVPAPSVEAVDGTGAGDAFIAGFIAAQLRGWTLLKCAQAGNAAGALCVGALGATAGVTSWDATQTLMAQLPRSTL
jgi:sugar/nucleoside kinase (ribokinase family)